MRRVCIFAGKRVRGFWRHSAAARPAWGHGYAERSPRSSDTTSSRRAACPWNLTDAGSLARSCCTVFITLEGGADAGKAVVRAPS